MSDRNWTPEQQDAIESVGTNLLVSAAAGSGKTTVLTERCVHLVCDADDKCDVGDLLVVTYTEAAAAEMKSKFAKALAARYAKDPDSRIGKQLAMVERAYIGTLHGFCSRVLRRHFNQIGLDPGFRILDPDEASLLRVETAEKLFADRYAQEPDDFRNFVDAYSGGDDGRLVSLVLRSHDLLSSMLRPPEWLRNSQIRIDDAIRQPLADSELGKVLLADVQLGIEGVIQRCEVGLATIGARGALSKYHGYLADIHATILHVRDVFSEFGIDGAADVLSTLEFPRLPTISSEVEGKDRGKQLIDEVRDEIKTGTWRKSLAFTEAEWIDGLERIRPHLTVLLSLLADFAERFAAAKLDEAAVDFADLERLTLQCLTDVTPDGKLLPNAIARGYQTSIKHVLVDEYQDINQLQDAILSLLSHERSKLPANVFCVGDVKQSIYRFRLADPRQFLARRQRYLPGKAGRVIGLQQNFRSRAPLLDVINELFSAVMSRDATELDYDDSQKLKPGAGFPPAIDGTFAGAPVELHVLDSAAAPVDPEEDLGRIEIEAVLIGKRILELTGKSGKPAKLINDRGTYRPARFGDVVVLLRSLKNKADPVAAVLRRMEIAVFNESRTGYFTATEINDVLATLHLLDNVRQDIPLAAFLRGPIAKLTEPESAMATIRVAYPESAFSAAVWLYAGQQDDPLARELRRLRDRLAGWRQLAREEPVSELLRVLYQETTLLTYVAGLPGGQQRVANLLQLQERAAQFGSFRRQGLCRFLAFLEKLKDQSDLGQAAISSEAEDVVRIVSIHASKGLEFPIVIVPDLGKGINFTEERSSVVVDRDFGFGLAVVDEEREVQYPSLASMVVKQRLHRQTLAEESRVLYVATTRAKEHLILIGTAANTQLQRWRAAKDGTPPGPLPPEMVLAANCPLDWIAPAALRAPGGMFEISLQADAPDASIGAMPARETALSERHQARADLVPIEPKPDLSTVAAGVIARVTAGYEFTAATKMAAVASVTSLVKKTPAAGESSATSARPPVPPVALELPAFLGDIGPMSAADRGTATHAVLEFLKFEDADSVAAIHRQVDALATTGLITAAAKSEVNVDAIDWMMHEPIGALLRSNADRVRREVPIYFDTGDGDSMDRQMVRGRIDLMVDDGGGWVIVDYKTDRVKGTTLDDRVALYAGQLRHYAAAIRRITGMPVKGASLVFLTPRVVRDVPVD